MVVLGLALPDNEKVPTQFRYRFLCCLIALEIAIEFFVPKFGVGRGSFATRAIVAMPKAAVNEDNFIMPREDNIGAAGKVAAMEAEAIAKTMQRLTDFDFRGGVFVFYPRHIAATLLLGKCVGHDLGRNGLKHLFDGGGDVKG